MLKHLPASPRARKAHLGRRDAIRSPDSRRNENTRCHKTPDKYSSNDAEHVQGQVKSKARPKLSFSLGSSHCMAQICLLQWDKAGGLPFFPQGLDYSSYSVHINPQLHEQGRHTDKVLDLGMGRLQPHKLWDPEEGGTWTVKAQGAPAHRPAAIMAVWVCP